MATHSAQQLHACSYCDKTFHRKDYLKNHLHTHDPNKMALWCEECGKKYNTKLGYKRHLALHAATSGALTCWVCTKKFEKREILLEHLKSHAGKAPSGIKERKHKCDHCEHYFYTRKDVRRHMVVHTGCKDFVCQFCAQRFGRKDHLTRHTKKTHSQELLKGIFRNKDFQGISDRISTFQPREEASATFEFPQHETTPNEIMHSLQVGHRGPYCQSQPSLESAHRLSAAAFTPRMIPLDNHLTINALPPSLPVASSQKLSVNKYELASTSFASRPIKDQPIMLNVKGCNVNMLKEHPLPVADSPHKVNPEASMQASPKSTEFGCEYTMQKNEGHSSENVTMSSMEIAHILGLWQLPLGGIPNATDNRVLPYANDQPAHMMTFPVQQQQNVHIAMGGVDPQLHQHLPPTFSSSLALPHFHHAFK